MLPQFTWEENQSQKKLYLKLFKTLGMNLRKITLAVALVITVISSGFVFYANNETLAKIAEKFLAYQAKRPIEKVFLHFDKPYYAIGEDIWFKAYLVDGLKLSPDSSISRVMYVELMNAEHKIIERHTLPIPEGVTSGDFHLADTVRQGNYLIRAYTNYMKNFGEDFFFTKEISIFDPGAKIENPSPSAQSKPDVQFFPEGGNLVEGIESRVAFKALSSKERFPMVQKLLQRLPPITKVWAHLSSCLRLASVIQRNLAAHLQASAMRCPKF
jgi:hypothetical protein